MFSFFDVVIFDVWNIPYIAWIFAQRIARVLASPWPVEEFFVRIFLWYPHQVEIKNIVFRVTRKPDDRFIAT